MNKPELLAPAGGRDALVAAIQSGANAVYLGAGSFNARQSADNFGGSALADAIHYAHARNVRVHVTLNTLVREDERGALIQAIEEIASAGADAVLVQDFGVARLVREIAPELPLHASTQMAAHNRAAVEFLADQGFARAVLAREMSMDEIRACSGLGIETEVFVHGALCVACSGQCLFSSLVGGRSGNRGRCAQPCRLPYRMGDREGYLLSTRDLCAIENLGALTDAGVASLKIEGRLKRPEYVSVVVRAYRNALDGIQPDARTLESLKQMFNRGGFTEGYLNGVTDAQLIYSARPNHLGVAVGKCIQNGKIRLNADLDPADTLVLRAAAQKPKFEKARASKNERVESDKFFGESLVASAARDLDCMESLAADRPVKLMGRAGETAASSINAAGNHLKTGESLVASAARDLDCMESLAADRPVKLMGRTGETISCPDARKGDALIRLVSERQMLSAREFCAEEHCATAVNARLKLRVGQPLELTVTDGIHPCTDADSVPQDEPSSTGSSSHSGGVNSPCAQNAVPATNADITPQDEPSSTGSSSHSGGVNSPCAQNAVSATNADISPQNEASSTGSSSHSGGVNSPCAQSTASADGIQAARESCESVDDSRSCAARASGIAPSESVSVFNDASSANAPVHTATAFGGIVERAQNRGADPDRVRAQIEKTGGTAYCMNSVELDMDSDAFCPVSTLNAMRRNALEKLDAMRTPKPYALHAPSAPEPIAHSRPKFPEIIVESANPEALRRAMQSGAAGAIFSPEDVRLGALNAALNALPEKFFLAPPMVLGERSLEGLNAWANAHSDRLSGVYLTNIGQFAFDWFGEIRADFSLNAANREAIRQLRAWGVNRIAPSVELTASQLSLLDGPLEWIVHGYLPLMQLRHCPYRTTHGLSGKHAFCRRCDSAADPITGKTLIDRTGTAFTLRRVATDEGCIVRIMNSVPLMLLKRANRLPKADAWRVMTENADEAEALVRLYALAARGADFKADPEWQKYESLSATTGHFFRGVE